MMKIFVSIPLIITLAIAGTVDGDITCYECSEPNSCTTFTGDENYNFGTPRNCSGRDHCVKTVDSGGKITRSCGEDVNVGEEKCNTDNSDMETCQCKTDYCNRAGFPVGSAYVLAVGLAVTHVWQL